MRARLKKNAEEKVTNESENRVLISNIAHDLKTPITAVKATPRAYLTEWQTPLKRSINMSGPFTIRQTIWISSFNDA